MIQTAAPSVSNSIASPSGFPAGNGAPGSENGTFADILAGQPGQDSAAPTAGSGPLEPTDASADLGSGQPNLAATLPLAGKILPDLLLDLAGPADQTIAEADAAAPGLAVPTLLTALRAMRIPQQMLSAAKSTTPANDPASTAADDETDDGTTLLGLAGVGMMATTTAAAAAANPAEGASPATSTLPPMIEAQLLGRPLQVQGEATAAAQLAAPGANDKTDTLALKLDSAQTNLGAAGALAFEADSARPTSAVRLRPVIAGEFDGKTLANAEMPGTDAASLLASPMSADSSLAAPATTSAVAQSARPHDFAALMDRLITARDAAQVGLPQSVQVAVNHAEFGQISLNFQQDKAGLAVSVGSADPDFARAVQAAIPAVAAAAAMDSARDGGQREGNQGSGGQNAFTRGDASTAGNDSGQRGQRGNAANGSDEAAPASNRSQATRGEASPRQRGIFA